MNPEIHLDAQIEAVLFWKAEPLSIKKLAAILEKSEEDIRAGIATLKATLVGRGLTLVELDDTVSLGTAAHLSSVIEKMTKEDLIKDLGKAGLETISIVLYQGPISRAEIDYIRGVNSQFILRNLLIRGLVEKIENPEDKRAFLYKPTIELITFMGLSSISALPEYENVRNNIARFKESQQSEKSEN